MAFASEMLVHYINITLMYKSKNTLDSIQSFNLGIQHGAAHQHTGLKSTFQLSETLS